MIGTVTPVSVDVAILPLTASGGIAALDVAESLLVVAQHFLDTAEDCGGAGLKFAEAVGDLPEGCDACAAESDCGDTRGK